MIKLAEGIWIQDGGKLAGHVFTKESGGETLGHIFYIERVYVRAAWNRWLSK